MAIIEVLPGVNRPDLAPRTSAQDALQSAMGEALIDVAIVGRDVSGQVRVWGSQPDADAAIGLMMRGASFLASAQQVHMDEEGEGA